MGAEVGRLVTSAREEAPKQRKWTGRSILTSFSFCPAYAEVPLWPNSNANKQDLDDKSPTSASR